MAEGEPWQAVIGPAAIITVATPARPAGPSPLPTEIRIAVVAHQDPLRVVSDIGSADIEEPWRCSSQQERHQTLGLYSSILATGNEPGRAAPRSGDCEESVRATVDQRLTERRIHIAREAANLPCLLNVAVSHLTHHAAAEGEAFKVLATAEHTSGGDVDILVKAAVDQELATYDVDRMQMRDETDTVDEIDKVQNAWS